MANKQIKDFEESESFNENDLLLIQTQEGYTRKIKVGVISTETSITNEEYLQLEKEIFGDVI